MYTRFSFISYEEFLNGAALNIFVVMILIMGSTWLATFYMDIQWKKIDNDQTHSQGEYEGYIYIATPSQMKSGTT